MQTVGRAHMAVAAMWREVSPAVTGLLGEASWDASELLIGVYSTFATEFFTKERVAGLGLGGGPRRGRRERAPRGRGDGAGPGLGEGAARGGGGGAQRRAGLSERGERPVPATQWHPISTQLEAGGCIRQCRMDT